MEITMELAQVSWPQGKKTFFSNQMSIKFILLINFKMPTLVRGINTISESFKAELL